MRIWLPSSRGVVVLAQLAIILLGLALLYGNPPAQGRILLVPMTAGARAHLVPDAVAHGARLVASGRLPGSMVVEGQRDALLPLLRGGILPLRAFAAACGEPVGGLA